MELYTKINGINYQITENGAEKGTPKTEAEKIDKTIKEYGFKIISRKCSINMCTTRIGGLDFFTL